MFHNIRHISTSRKSHASVQAGKQEGHAKGQEEAKGNDQGWPRQDDHAWPPAHRRLHIGTSGLHEIRDLQVIAFNNYQLECE